MGFRAVPLKVDVSQNVSVSQEESSFIYKSRDAS